MFSNSKILIFQFFFFIEIYSNLSQEQECCFDSSYALWNRNYVTLSYFQTFSELKFNCNLLMNITQMEILPLKRLILNGSLNFNGLRIRSIELSFIQFKLMNLKGFDLNSQALFYFTNLSSEKIWLNVAHSYFQFYSNNSLITTQSCHSNLPNWNLIQYVNIFDLQINIFQTDLCPFIFRNALIHRINIEKLTFSFLDSNFLGFQNVSALQLNSIILEFSLKIYHGNLNEKLLNKHVFKQLVVLDLNEVINSIQADLFKSFKRLRLIRFKSQNVKRLFATNNNWLNSLNMNVKVDLNNMDSKVDFCVILVIQQLFINLTFYDFPIEDFCLFKQFPHQRMVLPKLKPTRISTCTCTELFLIQYSRFYSKSINLFLSQIPNQYDYFNSNTYDMYEEVFSKCLQNKEPKKFEELLENCDFGKRLRNCEIKQTNKETNSEDTDFMFYMDDWNEVSILINSLFTTYINLIFSCVSILINLLFVIVLSTKSIMKERMYKFLLINSYFNLFYSFILTIKFILNNLGLNSIQFYIFSQTIYSQYINLIFGKILTNLFRTKYFMV
jgi:hypothetical protein